MLLQKGFTKYFGFKNILINVIFIIFMISFKKKIIYFMDILCLLHVFIQPVDHILSSFLDIRFILRIDIFSFTVYKTMSLSRVNFNFIINFTVLFKLLLQLGDL